MAELRTAFARSRHLADHAQSAKALADGWARYKFLSSMYQARGTAGGVKRFVLGSDGQLVQASDDSEGASAATSTAANVSFQNAIRRHHELVKRQHFLGPNRARSVR